MRRCNRYKVIYEKGDYMRRLILKGIVFILLLTTCFIGNFKSVCAYNLIGGRLNGGVGNWGRNTRYYWVDSSASNWNSEITAAYNSWINTNKILRTPISWAQTSTKSNGTVEFYVYNESDGACGATYHYRYSSKVNPTNENWGWCIVYYNSQYNVGKSVFAHEIGHTMGLNENNGDVNSIMCQYSHGRVARAPSYDDLSGINAMYN